MTIDGRRLHYRLGKPVDPTDVMPDGTPFAHVDEFKQLLLRDKPQIARALTSKLIAYSTGKAPQPPDRATVDAIVASNANDGYGLRSLVHEIVQSELFHTK